MDIWNTVSMVASRSVISSKFGCMHWKLTIVFFFLSVALFAQRTEKVKYSTIYKAEKGQTAEQAMLMAVKFAKEYAIDSVFGTQIHVANTSYVSVGGGRSVDEFVQIGRSDVRGRWIKDLHEPIFGDIKYDPKNSLWAVPVTISGVVQEVKSAPIACQVKVLCNGTDDGFARSDFKDGNKIFLNFVAPVSGYLAVYLVDAELNVFRYLPYDNQDVGSYKVERGKEYTFFSKQKAFTEDIPFVEEFMLVTDRDAETNMLYVIFSPNKFTIPIDKLLDPDLPRQLTWKEFNSWLGKSMSHDEEMIGEQPIMIHIYP